jgi:hypothetical protein
VLNYETVMNWPFADVVQTYTARDTILYALGLGYGADPTDSAELPYVYEKELVAAPTYPVVLGNQGPWMTDPRTGIDWVRSLHGEQGLKIFAPFPPQGTIVGKNRVVGVIDKGPGKGALLMMERDIVDQESGKLLAMRTSTSFLRGDGGCGAPAMEQAKPVTLPDNPMHVDPAVARKAGFERPILHGLCTFGVIGRALVATVCDGDPAALKELGGRFSSVVYPGDTITVDIWREDAGEIKFRARIAERNAVVFNNGHAVIA